MEEPTEPADWEITVTALKEKLDRGEPVMIISQAGFKKISNLKGGILAWADQVDHTLPK